SGEAGAAESKPQDSELPVNLEGFLDLEAVLEELRPSPGMVCPRLLQEVEASFGRAPAIQVLIAWIRTQIKVQPTNPSATATPPEQAIPDRSTRAPAPDRAPSHALVPEDEYRNTPFVTEYLERFPEINLRQIDTKES